MFVSSTDLSWMDQSVLDLELVPYFIPIDFDTTQLGFTWKVERYIDSSLDLKVIFTNAAYISMNEVQDKMHIKFNASYFIAEATTEPLDKDYWTISTSLKKQLVDN